MNNSCIPFHSFIEIPSSISIITNCHLFIFPLFFSYIRSKAIPPARLLFFLCLSNYILFSSPFQYHLVFSHICQSYILHSPVDLHFQSFQDNLTPYNQYPSLFHTVPLCKHNSSIIFYLVMKYNSIIFIIV